MVLLSIKSNVSIGIFYMSSLLYLDNYMKVTSFLTNDASLINLWSDETERLFVALFFLSFRSRSLLLYLIPHKII
jgi:hypothetical protein